MTWCWLLRGNLRESTRCQARRWRQQQRKKIHPLDKNATLGKLTMKLPTHGGFYVCQTFGASGYHPPNPNCKWLLAVGGTKPKSRPARDHRRAERWAKARPVILAPPLVVAHRL
jgi:hypothetical protein